MMFQDRRDAGKKLAWAIEALRDWTDTIVLGLPRGGVPVAYEVSTRLNLPLDIFIVRKLGMPGREELAIGAIASDGPVVINQSVVDTLGVSPEAVEAAVEREKLEIKRRERAYREGRPPEPIEGRTALLIDDGLATGASMLAAVRALRPRAREIVVAVPVAAEETCDEIRREVNQIICCATPRPFFAVGMFYSNFAQTTDEEVRTLLGQARSRQNPHAA